MFRASSSTNRATTPGVLSARVASSMDPGPASVDRIHVANVQASEAATPTLASVEVSAKIPPAIFVR